MARRRSVALLVSLILLPRVMAAQAARRPESVKDNSFLIEEACNQDPGVVQHINTFAHALRGSDWSYSFTQEWPVGGMRHQLSATTSRAAGLLLSPGVRWAYNVPHGLQVVPGLALPIGIGPNRGWQSLLTYLSFEHPF